VSGSTATFAGAGSCTITASQPGNATYAAATPVSQTFTVATPTPIVPYVNVNGVWTETATATVVSGSPVNLGPQPLTGGSWSWTGPNGFTSTSREIDKIPLSVGTNVYVVTYTNAAGAKSTETFTITVTAGTFTLSAAAGSVTVTPTIPGRDVITVTPVNGFTGTVSFTVSGLPSDVNAAFSPTSLTTRGSTTLTLTRARGADAHKSTTLTITGTSGSISASKTITLNY
jgi:hypothetical protein